MYDELLLALALEVAFKRIRRASNATARASLVALLFDTSAGSTSEPARALKRECCERSERTDET